MHILVIGLGSMGKRRVRNLLSLQAGKVSGFDIREDRREEAKEKYAISVYADIANAFACSDIDAVVISTPPKLHMHYANLCFDQKIPCFIEASVTDREAMEILSAKACAEQFFIAPSCTMRFYPGPMKIKALLQAGVIGKVLSVNYHTGQYLPDWHPWESIQDYYVSERETGGAREIVPFELTWLNDLFGVPEVLSCVVTKLTDMDADIDDIYHCMLLYPENILMNLTVDVISRPRASREMTILGASGIIRFSAETNSVSYCNTQNGEWTTSSFESGTIESQYINPEEPYINEIGTFLRAIKENNPLIYPNTLAEDAGILKTLETLEQHNVYKK